MTVFLSGHPFKYYRDFMSNSKDWFMVVTHFVLASVSARWQRQLLTFAAVRMALQLECKVVVNRELWWVALPTTVVASWEHSTKIGTLLPLTNDTRMTNGLPTRNSRD